MKQKLPVIIDCDPGIDDALALLMIYKYKHMFDIKLISSTAGNTPIDITTRNVQFFANKFFNGVKVAKGIGQPLKKVHPDSAEDVHGVGGFGDFVIGSQDYPYMDNSVEAMKNVLTSASGRINIIALGPLTNIAKLLLDYPEVKDKIAKIYTMIGSINGIGNVRPYAEFNAYFDPDAFKIVSESGIPMVINPMELGHNSRIKKSVFAETEARNSIHDMIKSMVSGAFEFRDPTLISIFDLNTPYSIIKPDLYTFTPCDIAVTLDGECDGKCILTENKDSIHCYCQINDVGECNGEILDDLFSIEE